MKYSTIARSQKLFKNILFHVIKAIAVCQCVQFEWYQKHIKRILHCSSYYYLAVQHELYIFKWYDNGHGVHCSKEKNIVALKICIGIY